MKLQKKHVALFVIIPAAVLAVVLLQLPGQTLGNSANHDMTSSSTSQYTKTPVATESPDMSNHNSMTEDVQENKPTSDASDGITVRFAAQPIIHKYDLGEIKMNITDAASKARLSHVDWAIAVKNPQGDVFYKTTTAHSHVGMMDFKVSFPYVGENTVSVTTSSIGTAMMGLEPTPKGRTHTMISGSLKGFKTDPLNNFGSRTFEFPVYVQQGDNTGPSVESVAANSNQQTMPMDVTHTAPGDNGTSVNIELQSPQNIVAGQPSTFVLTLTRTSDNSMVTHPDLQITATTNDYTVSQSAALKGEPTINGAIHGHTGIMTWTPTFPSPGKYTVTIDMSPSTLTNYQWGFATTKFDVFVQSQGTSANESSQGIPENTVNILGLESPFFSPNVLNVKAGTTVTFVNTDAASHTVTSVKSGTEDPDGVFDSGLLSPKKNTFSFKFDKPGTYEYICSVHTHMRGTIIVS